MPFQVNPNNLPTGTNVYFLILLISSVMVALWSGQFLPGPEYFTTPFAAQFQVGLYSTYNGIYGVAILALLGTIFFLYHSRRQRSVFGPSRELTPQHPLWDRLNQLSQQSGVKLSAALHDEDITNTDAVAFGFARGRTILMGRGMLLLSLRRPSNFMARVAHEFGHFKNGDIKYAFLSRSLLQANLVLMVTVAVWLCFQPIRVIVMQYYLATSPMGGLPGVAPKLFFTMKGTFWLRYWWNQTLGSLSITAPVFAFWALLLFLEYRSLLRTREILADARAAQWIGSDALLDALTGGKPPPRPSVKDRLYEMFSAHPLVSQRVNVVLQPHQVLNPSLLRFLFLGYFYSLTNYLITNIDILIQIIDTNYGKLRAQGNAMEAALSVLRFDNPIVTLIYLVVVAAFASTYMIVVSTLLRSCLSRKIAGQSHGKWLRVTVVQITFVALGNVLGDAFHPYSQAGQAELSSKVMLGHSVGGLFFHPIGINDFTNQATLCGILLGTAVLLWLEASFILRGSRNRPIKSWQWGLLMIFTFLCVFQVWSIFWVVSNYSDFRNPLFFAMGFLQAAFFLLLAAVIVWFMRGHVRKDDQAPPWLLAQ